LRQEPTTLRNDDRQIAASAAEQRIEDAMKEERDRTR
jgi:hypothetical protein